VVGAWRGVVDLAGTSNRVTELSVTAGGIVTNRAPATGALYADALALRGALAFGTRVSGAAARLMCRWPTARARAWWRSRRVRP
jgi:hypothetical protein